MKLRRKNRKPTLSDVAALAGVSKTAASTVLNDGKGKTTKVGEETAAAIREAAKKVGYQANLTARSLATGRTGFIGFMLSSTVSDGWMNPYFASFLQGAEAECRSRGFALAVACASIAEAGSFIHSDILSQRRIDALIVAGELDTEIYSELRSSGIPFIVLNSSPTQGLPIIEPKGIDKIIDYALSKGHREIWVTRDRRTYPNAKSFEEMLSEGARKGVRVELVVPSEGQHPNWEPGFGLGLHLFERWKAASAKPSLLVSNGVLIEFHKEFSKAGFKCPKDLSMLGDNSYNFVNSSVNFTKLHIDHAKIGSDAARLLCEAVSQGEQVSSEKCAAFKYELKILEGETVG